MITEQRSEAATNEGAPIQYTLYIYVIHLIKINYTW